MHSDERTPSGGTGRRSDDRTETTTEATEGGPGDDPTTILLVEDNEGDARLIRELLQMKGGIVSPGGAVSRNFEIDHVERLADAEPRLRGDAVDIVLLDLMLPDSRGEETLDAVLDQTSDLPIIVMTGLNDRDFGVKAVRRGAQDFLVKGEFDGELLARTIRYAIERKKNERQLAARTEELEILTRILHHDIRNDMNIARGTIRMGMSDVDSEARESFETALSNVEHAIEITETVEPLLESITGDGSLETEPVELDRMLDEELRKLVSSYPDVTVEAPEPTDATVSANHMLSSVFGNLLNNAVQHNDGDPTVAVRTTVDEREGVARVTVADDGPGVSADQREGLFERAPPGSSSSDTGVGLYLVDVLTAEYGGDVWVEDSDLGGAAFVVELSLADES